MTINETLEDLKAGGGQALEGAHEAGGTASAKACRAGPAWCVQGPPGRPRARAQQTQGRVVVDAPVTASPEQGGLVCLSEGGGFWLSKPGATGRVRGQGGMRPDLGFIYFSFLFM